MKKAIYPGSFDPVTNGHIDIIERSKSLFKEVVVLVVKDNPSKELLFSTEEKIEMIKESIKHYSNVSVDSFEGLLVEKAKTIKADVIIRGLRAISDFEYEFQIALMNRRLSSKINTVFMMPNEKYTYLNSSIVKEVARLGGDISAFVPKHVEEKLKEKFKLK
ncbi:pantetheine-phosphate adenylyltransferase [candidate division KSB1 bacterium]